MVLAISWVDSGGIRWFQLVLDHFRSFQVVLRVSKYGISQCWFRFDVLIFVQRFTSYLSQVLHPTCSKISNFRNIGQVKSHIRAARYQIVPLSRLSIYFFHLYENPPVRHTY